MPYIIKDENDLNVGLVVPGHYEDPTNEQISFLEHLQFKYKGCDWSGDGDGIVYWASSDQEDEYVTAVTGQCMFFDENGICTVTHVDQLPSNLKKVESV